VESGLDWVNFWDEISIDRTVAWVKHANSDGNVSKIAASAIKRSGEITPSSTAELEQEDETPWDTTNMTEDIGRRCHC
jgi:hypothetical protein